MPEISFGSFSFESFAMPGWGLPILYALISILVMLLIKRLMIGRIEGLLSRTSFKLDSLLIRAASFPLTVVIVAINLGLLAGIFDPDSVLSADTDKTLALIQKLLLIVAVILFVDRLCNGAVEFYSPNSEMLRSSKSIVRGILRGLIFGLGVLVLLGTLGISVTPIIASLGITSLAVALALQPTLENFFSGVQLVIDKPIRVGDFIELESGEQGFVEKIGWRSTWVRMLPNNIVIMPNSALSDSKIINYYYPAPEMSVLVEVGVHYDSDLAHVEEVTVDVARQVLKDHEWGVDSFDPFVVFHTFDSSSINFTVVIRVEEFFKQFLLKSAFIKALHKRYAEEGIVIPYPIRAVNLDQEGARDVLKASD
mgnify:CR=1 FL=1